MSMELAFNILLTIASFALGLLIKRLYGEIDSLRKQAEEERKYFQGKIEMILTTYQTKNESQINQQQILNAISDVKNKINRLDDKFEARTSK